MKIWFPVIKGGSGTDVYTRRLAHALERRGIDTEISWFPTYYQMAPFLLSRIRPPSGTSLIHANSWNGFAFRRAGIALIVTEHLPVFDPGYTPYKTLPQRVFHATLIRCYESASLRVASAITAVSRATAQSLAAHMGVDRAVVIPNWVNTSIFRPREKEIPAARSAFRLLFIGNLSRRKGADLLRPIMAALGPGFELRFTSGLRKSRVLAAAANCVPLGQLNGDAELLHAYHDSDALLFPSRLEGLPQVPLEAMACAKPVIGAHIRSTAEVVEHGVSGILCPVDNIQAFVSACRELAHRPETLEEMGRAARRRVQEHFSEEQIIPQYIALYEKLVSEAPTDAGTPGAYGKDDY